MCSDASEAAQQCIDEADIPSTVYRTAMRLLHRVDGHTGTVTVSEADLMAICQTEAEGTMRSHLVQLAAAGIVRYRRRGLIYIQFEAWANPELPWDDEDLIAERSNLDAERQKGGPIRALSDQNGEPESEELIAERSNSEMEPPNRALSDQKPRAERSKSASTSHARSGRWVGRSLPSTEKRKKPTYPPTSHDPPLEPMQQLALELLEDSDVGVIHEVALMLVLEKPPQDIFRMVDKWLPDAQAGKVGPGVLKHRIETLKPSDMPTVSLSAGFLVSDLFQRHRLPDEMIAEPPRRKYSIDEAYPDDTQPRRKYSQ
jgi:hypothetical protein